jgi:hypothetical protein
MPWLPELAIVLSYVLKHYLEAGIIFALLTVNTAIGQIQARGRLLSIATISEAKIPRNCKKVPGDFPF